MIRAPSLLLWISTMGRGRKLVLCRFPPIGLIVQNFAGFHFLNGTFSMSAAPGLGQPPHPDNQDGASMEQTAPHFTCVLHGSRKYSEVPFPLCIHAANNPAADDLRLGRRTLANWAASHRAEIESLLSKHGAVIFRGFGAASDTPEKFAAFTEAGLQLPNFPYELGNAVRTPVVGDRVFTANESPPDKPIPFHHELAQTPKFPARILFYCDTPASIGGETPLVLSTAVYDQLRKQCASFVDKLELEGVVYSRVMTAHDRPSSAIGRGWRATFGAETQEDVEAKLEARGYDWDWIGEGKDAMLREISPVLEAVRDLGNGKKSFFNQLVAVWGGWKDEFNEPENCIRFGNGDTMGRVGMHTAARIMAENRVAIPWEKGDIIYIDNYQVQHARNPFEGKRRVLASLAMRPAE